MMQTNNFKPMLLSISLLAFVSVMFVAPLEAGCYDRREPGMDWSGCKKTNKMLDDADFTRSRFDDAILMMSNLDNSRFTGASLVKTDMSRVSAKRSHFEDADLSKSVGYRAVFDHATIKNSVLTKSEYFRASFRAATISDVDWSRSELGRVDFSQAQLRNVSFQFSNISRVLFTGAKLDGVDFQGAYTYLTHFENVDLRRAENLSQLQIDQSCGDMQTKLPQGRWIPDTWPCEE